MVGARLRVERSSLPGGGVAVKNWRAEAYGDALDAAEYFLDKIVEAIIDNQGDAPTDIMNRQYDESYHHESHIDKSFSLIEAAHVLDDLDEFEETDSGMWEGLDPREAVKTQAAYTYGNAVSSMFTEVMQAINSAIDDAVGNEIFWDLEFSMQPQTKRNKRGVLEWRPGVVAPTEEEMEKMEGEFEKALKKAVKGIVERKIKEERG